MKSVYGNALYQNAHSIITQALVLPISQPPPPPSLPGLPVGKMVEWILFSYTEYEMEVILNVKYGFWTKINFVTIVTKLFFYLKFLLGGIEITPPPPPMKNRIKRSMILGMINIHRN